MQTLSLDGIFCKAAFARAAERIFCIHPLEAKTKKPHLKGYKTLATQDPDVLSRWGNKWPEANVGGLVPEWLAVLDVDPRHGGDQALAALIKQYGQFARTVTVKTPSGG